MDENSYIKQMLNEFCEKEEVDTEVVENTIKRLIKGYAAISDEISKEFELKAYQQKGVRP